MSVSYDEVDVESRAQLRDWLAANHAASPGIWLVTYKKSSGGPHVPYDDIVEEALCFGWIDSRIRRVDELRSALLLTPRKPKSRWSRSNKERIARLAAAGLLTPVGVAAVDLAKGNGSWTALDDVENLLEPDDLRTALDARPEARRHWDEFSDSARRAILLWILDAKRPQTRASRIEETVSEASEGRRAHR
jgi:uncharacterized protein YdeI (YjbR/CyaY-like superfamily)